MCGGGKTNVTNTGADLEIYEWWGYVIFAREAPAKILKLTPTFTSTSPTLPRTISANAYIAY